MRPPGSRRRSPSSCRSPRPRRAPSWRDRRRRRARAAPRRPTTTRRPTHRPSARIPDSRLRRRIVLAPDPLDAHWTWRVPPVWVWMAAECRKSAAPATKRPGRDHQNRPEGPRAGPARMQVSRCLSGAGFPFPAHVRTTVRRVTPPEVTPDAMRRPSVDGATRSRSGVRSPEPRPPVGSASPSCSTSTRPRVGKKYVMAITGIMLMGFVLRPHDRQPQDVPGRRGAQPLRRVPP